MHTYLHKYGGVVFRIESDIEIPFITRKNCSQAYEAQSRKHNVYFKFLGLDHDDSSLSPPSKDYLECLSKYVPYQDGPDLIYSSLLHYKIVTDTIDNVLGSSKNVTLFFHHDAGCIADFDRCRMYLFYLPQFRGLFDDMRVGYHTYAMFLPVFSAAQIHSAAIIRNESGLLFLAPDEGGKTTIAKNAKNESVILSDDQNIIRKHKNGYYLYSTPWAMITNGPNKVKLAAIFLLRKARNFKIEKASQREMMLFLWNEHSNCHGFIPKDLRKNMFELFWELSAQRPIYRLYFPKNYVDWQAVDAALEGKLER